MSPDQKRAKDLYIKGRKPSEIAEELELSIGTVYKWIKDEKLCFEKDKKVANFSVEAMGELLLIAYKEFIIDISEGSEIRFKSTFLKGLLPYFFSLIVSIIFLQT